MENWNFKNIRLVIGEPMDDVRFGLRAALSGAGFEQIEDTGEISIVRESVANNGVDLLVCDMHLLDGDMGNLIHQIRHQEIGNNPFVTIITLIPMADEQMIRKVMGSGTDDILVLPVSPENLMKRVVHLIHERKPFVVTTDYIGPDRREGHRPGTQKIPLIEVPNLLKIMVEGEPDWVKLQTEIEATALVLNEQKIERHAYQIVYLVEKIAQIYPMNPGDESVLSNLDRLARVSNDINDRVDGSHYAHWGERCRSLVNVMKRVRDAHMTPNNTDVFELRNLAEAFKNEISREERAARFG